MAFADVLRKIVRNDAMRTDPDAIYNLRVVLLVCASCFGGMLFGWDTGAIGGVLSMKETQAKFGYANANATDIANFSQNIVSTLQAGCFAACFVTSWFADRFGRRWSLVGSGAVTSVGIIFQACSAINGNLPLMYVGRFVAGLGVGAASTLTPLYVSECVPRAIRGGLTAFYQFFIVTGIMVSFWVNYGCQLHVKGAGLYIIPLALQALPAVILMVGMALSPESPRWCATKDDWESATSILSSLRALPADSDYVANELRDMSSQLESERRLMGDATFKGLMREMWTVPANRKRAIMSVILMTCQQLTGVNAINYYAPQIFKNLGLSGQTTGLFATGVYGLVKMAACGMFLLFVADSLGRRKSLLITSPLLTVVLFIIGIYGRVQPPVTGEPVSAFGYVSIVCIYLWAGLFQFGWGPAIWILVSEIPTARLRALNVAIASATQWLFNFVMARSVLTMQNTMGYKGYGMFFMFGSFDVLMGLYVWFFVPETKGIALEKMDELFGLAEAVKDVEGEPERTTSIHEANTGKN